MASSIDCKQHGSQPETFVCQHIASSMATNQHVGFFWSSESKEERPDAWCWECEMRVRKTDGVWKGEAAKYLGAKILCGACYDHAKDFFLKRKVSSSS